jgi:diguanylate cyclase (GGDEF)-like protein
VEAILDDHALAGAPSLSDRTGQSTDGDVEHVPPGVRSLTATIDAIVRAWSTACELPAFGSSANTFEDPPTIVHALLGSAQAPTDRSAVDTLERAVLQFRVHPGVAVVQLVALSRVLHSSRTEGRGIAEEHRTDLDVDRSINIAIAAILDDLEQRGLVDPLTGLLNRRALDRDLVELVRAASRNDRCLVVVMADLEGLKDTNDSLGHSAGDARLRSAAGALAATLRSGDNVYRIGGDEFVVLMPDLELRDLEAVLGRVDDVTATSLTWGCAWERIQPDVNAEREAARLLELADQRLLRYRWSGHSVPVARDASGAIVAGRFGPLTERPSRRR